ncbi:hypothetical protein GCM10009787_65040 [Streptomyces bangladeshensis]|uniref:Uncharacterized protein n=1 Tax=Streptomyces bangladeshensis TaxID=295352 RepID=A0ABN3C1M6_9ACTN
MHPQRHADRAPHTAPAPAGFSGRGASPSAGRRSLPGRAPCGPPAGCASGRLSRPAAPGSSEWLARFPAPPGGARVPRPVPGGTGAGTATEAQRLTYTVADAVAPVCRSSPAQLTV